MNKVISSIVKQICQTCMKENYNNALEFTMFIMSQIDWEKVEAEVKYLYTLPIYTLMVTHN